MLTPINPNKTKESIAERVVSQEQKVDFNSFLLEFKRKQFDALSGFLGGEDVATSNPISGYHHMLLNSLAQRPAGVGGIEKNYNLQKVLEQYRTFDSVNHTSKPLIHDLVIDAAKKNGIPEQWFEKLIKQESAFDPTALSPKGAMGLGQLMPATAKDLGLRLTADNSEGSVWNPVSNLNASARYLRQLYDRYTGMGIEEGEARKFASGAYNAGMGNIQKAIDKLDDNTPLTWEQAAKILPEVTGYASGETLRYVENLHA